MCVFLIQNICVRIHNFMIFSKYLLYIFYLIFLHFLMLLILMIFYMIYTINFPLFYY